jgi:tetratricopeptide (TPR) repeat protein
MVVFQPSIRERRQRDDVRITRGRPRNDVQRAAAAQRRDVDRWASAESRARRDLLRGPELPAAAIAVASSHKREKAKRGPAEIFERVAPLLETKPAEAITQLRAGIRRTKDPSGELHFQLGVAMMKLRNYEGGRRVFEKALKRNPALTGAALANLASCEFAIGQAFENIGRPDLARARYERSAEHAPTRWAPRYRLGWLAETGDDARTAVEHYQKAIDLFQGQQPPDADQPDLLGALALRLAEAIIDTRDLDLFARGLAAARKAIELKPKSASGYVAYATLGIMEDSPEQMRDTLRAGRTALETAGAPAAEIERMDHALFSNSIDRLDLEACREHFNALRQSDPEWALAYARRYIASMQTATDPANPDWRFYAGQMKFLREPLGET